MPRQAQMPTSQNSMPVQAPLQLGWQSQLQVSRFAAWVAGQARATASQTHWQATGSKAKPGAQVALSRHSQAQVVVLHSVKPPQLALQSGAHSAVHDVASQRWFAEGSPPQSSAHS
jgi:hypothetical protein